MLLLTFTKICERNRNRSTSSPNVTATPGRCGDAPDVEVDVRMYEMAVIMDLCPRNQMSRCLCHDNTVVKAPFDLESFYFQCRPKKASFMSDSTVRCNKIGQSVVKVKYSVGQQV